MALGTTNISTTLVANTIGVGSNDVGTLCTSSKINRWSKWKPVSYATVGSLNINQLKEMNYGLSIQSHNNYLDAYNEGIWYNPPIGGINSPYRLGDFRNYNHEAIAVFSKMSYIDVSKLDTDTCRIDFTYNIGGTDDLIGLSDFIGLPIGSNYLAVILTDGTNAFIKTSSININDGAAYIEFPIKSGYLQNYTGTLNAKFVLCSSVVTELSMLNSITGNIYYPLLVNIASDAMCDINISNSINMTMIVNKISTGLTTLYADLETYITTPANPDALYFRTSNGTVFLRITTTNNSANPVIITNNFALKAVPSLVGTTSGIIQCQLYDSTNSSVYSITVPANTTTTFKLGAPNILFMNNGLLSTPSGSIQTQTTISSYYKGDAVNIAIDGPINISN